MKLIRHIIIVHHTPFQHAQCTSGDIHCVSKNILSLYINSTDKSQSF